MLHKMIQIPLHQKLHKGIQRLCTSNYVPIWQCLFKLCSGHKIQNTQNWSSKQFEHKDDIDVSLLLFIGETNSSFLWNLTCVNDCCNASVVVLFDGFFVWAFLIYCFSLFEHLTFIVSDLSSQCRRSSVKPCQSDRAVLSSWRAFVHSDNCCQSAHHVH